MITNNMTPEEKIGQLFIASIDGFDMSGEMIHLLKTYQVGGIYYTEKNMKHPKQVNHLSYRLQCYSSREHPLFIATKQNGGQLNNIKGIIPSLNQQDLGKINNRVYTKRMAQYVGKELYGMGINMNLGPSINAGENESTSYSNQIDTAAKHGRAAIEGYHSQHILAVPGSFPAEIDILESDTPIYKTPLHSFDYVVEHDAKAILTKDALLTTPFLRNKLHFNGLIIQDYSETTLADGDSVITALNAGADMILLNDTYTHQMKIMDNVLEAFASGMIQEATIDAALERVFAMKEMYTVKEMAPFDRNLFARERGLKFVQQMESQLEKV